jgi:hypothetical protein
MTQDLIERLLAKKPPIKPRPTIAELEAILAQSDQPAIQINPDGSVSAESEFINPDGPEAAEEIARLREALKVAEDAINEQFRYWDGGETRGSYDGKPERHGLRRAQAIARAASEQGQ